jgi:hypothetical protein
MENTSRSYNCKDEELPVLCRFVLSGLKRDLADFTAFSPKFSETYCTNFETKIIAIEDLVSPKSETAEKKKITDRLLASMNSLLDPINRLSGYLDMAGDTIQISKVDFGLTDLRKGINTRDPEKVINRLKEVIQNIAKYKDPLVAQGLTDRMIDSLNTSYISISNDRQTQYSILTNRKAMVQSHIGMLNDLFAQMQEILNIGKILYKQTDAVKKQEYIFSELKKKVRRITKGTGEENPEPVSEN